MYYRSWYLYKQSHFFEHQVLVVAHEVGEAEGSLFDPSLKNKAIQDNI